MHFLPSSLVRKFSSRFLRTCLGNYKARKR
nr:MAG TPA: hypothetical protein [Caudoviricetes sp.]